MAASDITGVPYDLWTLSGGATKMAAVAANDGDTSKIIAALSNYRQCFNVAWPGGVASVNSLVANGTLRNTNASYLYPIGVGCRNASGENSSSVTMSGTSYDNYSHTCSRPGGGSWTSADCASGVTWLQVRTYTSPGGGQAYCTLLYLKLDYVPAAGGFSFLIWSVLGALSAGTIALSQMARVAAALARRGVALRSDEYEAAWRDMRADTHPAWSFA